MISLPLSQGYSAQIDDIDADLASHKWTAQHAGSGLVYAQRVQRQDGHQLKCYLHRAILSRMLDRPLGRKEYVDHINGNSLDNRRSNLRLASVNENARNSRHKSTNTSGYKGVSWSKHHKNWQAVIKVNSKAVHLGHFDTPEAAYAAYCEGAAKYHGEFANVN